MHALLIGDEGLGALAVRLHEEFLAVTFSAGDGNVGVIDGRVRIVCSNDRMHRAMAVGTTGRGATGHSGFCMGAMRIRCKCVGVATCTGEFLGRCFVGQAFDVGVAVDACEHGAVDRVLQLGRIDKQAVRLAVDGFGDRGVAVAGEAVFIFELVLGMKRRGPDERRHNETTRQQPTNRIHVFKMGLLWKTSL